jgi:hypothetical protein|nr:hypothetical protein [uncultured Rhodopila sp.]
MRTYLLIAASILVGPDSPRAETTVNTYARISAHIPACRLHRARSMPLFSDLTRF